MPLSFTPAKFRKEGTHALTDAGKARANKTAAAVAIHEREKKIGPHSPPFLGFGDSATVAEKLSFIVKKDVASGLTESQMDAQPRQNEGSILSSIEMDDCFLKYPQPALLAWCF